MVKNKFRQICWGFIMDTFESKGEKFIYQPSLDRQPVKFLQNWSDVLVLRRLYR